MSVSLYGSGNTVIQVVQAISTTTATTGSNSYSSTGFSASITPQSTTSKILVMAQLSFSTGGATGAGIGFAIYRGATAIWVPAVADSGGPYGAAYSQAANGARGQTLLTYLDSPATTSTTAYNIYFAIRSSTGTFNPTDNVNNGSSSLTLLEISGS
jgi:hypothetical protein